MATLLYRLASWAHRHRYRMLAMWLAAFIAIGVCASLFMGQLSNTFSLPGTETQRTMDRLKAELPDLAGGSGSIVFRESSNRALSATQREAINDSLEQLKLHPEVVDVKSPFELQRELDRATPELSKAQRELEDGQRKLDDGKQKVADGKKQLEDAQKKITEGWTKLFDGRKQLEAGAPQLAAAERELADGWDQLRRGEFRLAEGRSKLADGERQYADGLAEYREGKAKYDAGRKQFAAGEADLEKAVAQLKEGHKQYAQGEAQLLGDKSRKEFRAELAQGKSDTQAQLDQVEQGLTELADQQEKLTAQRQAAADQLAALEGSEDAEAIAKLEATISTLDQALNDLKEQQSQAIAGRTQLTEALAQIKAGEDGLAALDASRTKLQKAEEKLSDGRDQLESKRGELDKASATLKSGKANLDAAKQEIDTNKAKLDAASSQLKDSRAKLQAGQQQLTAKKAEFEAGKAKLDAAERELREGEQQLSEKKAELAQAEKDLEQGAKDLESGRAELEFASRQVGASEGMRFVSEDGTTAVAQVSFKGQTDALTAADREEITATAATAQATGVEVLFSKEILQDLSSVFGAAEIIGVIVAAVVLLAMLGTLVAAGLPLLLAILGVGAGVGTTLAFSSLVDMASITPALAMMLGLAVGIDYALFIIHRHRSQLLAGMEVGESIARAVGTSGNAVVFAGLTVIIALAALAVPGLPFLTVLGLSAAFTVFVAVLLAVTLLPALLAIAGPRLVSKRARARAANPVIRDPFASRWARIVTKVAIPATLVVIAALGAIALPAAQMRTALPDGSAEPVDSQAFQAYQQTSDKFGAGYNGPLLVLADLPSGLDQRQADSAALDVAERLRGYDGVITAIPVTLTEDRALAAIQVLPADGPASAGTEALVHQLRADADQIVGATEATQIAVTGQVAAQIDVSQKVTEALPPYLAIVVGLSLVLLLLVFRSIVVPLMATGGFLLSLAAAFGASVMVYQWGWFAPVFDVAVPGPLLSFLPILLTGILFGLAMDYQVFLVSAMRERYAHGEPSREAVRSGFVMAAPVVTAAALIMISVFAGFIFSHLSMIRPLGFALAFGVLFDAFVVRMTLIPALMHLLGDKAWYLPRWLDKILPDVDVEGAKLERNLPQPADADNAPDELGQDRANVGV